MTDLETLFRKLQDELRGYPPPPPTWRDRAREWLPEWRYLKGAPLLLMMGGVCFLISASLQLFAILVRE